MPCGGVLCEKIPAWINAQTSKAETFFMFVLLGVLNLVIASRQFYPVVAVPHQRNGIARAHRKIRDKARIIARVIEQVYRACSHGVAGNIKYQYLPHL